MAVDDYLRASLERIESKMDKIDSHLDATRVQIALLSERQALNKEKIEALQKTVDALKKPAWYRSPAVIALLAALTALAGDVSEWLRSIGR